MTEKVTACIFILDISV